MKRRRQPPAATFATSPWRNALVVLVAVKLFAIVAVLDPVGMQAFDLPKSLASRTLEWLIGGTLAIVLVRFGPSVLPRTRLWLFAAAFVLANVLSAITAANGYVALYGEFDRYLGLTYLADMAILALAVAVAFRTDRDWATLAIALLAAWALSAVYALAQLAGRDPVPWSLDARQRPFGTFGHPDIFGQFLSMIFGAALGVSAIAIGARRWQALAIALVTVALVGGVATRGSVLGVAAALVALPVVLVIAGRLPRLAARAALVGLAVAVMAAGGLWLSPLGRRVESTIAGAQIEDRLLIYEGALNAFVARPILGWGPDNFAAAYPSSRLQRSARYEGQNSISTSAHDWVLQVAATTGAVGLLTYLALLGATAWTLLGRGVRSGSSVPIPLLLALVAYLAHGLVTVGSISVDWIPWLALGAAASLTPTEASEQRRPWHAGVSLVVIGAAILGALTSIPAFTADQDAGNAQRNLTTQRAAIADTAASDATRLDPGRAIYWSTLGQARDLEGKFREGAAAFVEATQRAPYVSAYWTELASDRARQATANDVSGGGQDAAFAAAERAVAVDPYQPIAHATLARLAATFGQLDRATAEAFIAFDLYPGSFNDEVLATFAPLAPDKAAARGALERAINIRDTARLRAALATIELDMGDRDAAIRDARQALVLDPTLDDVKKIAQRLGL